MCEVWWVTLGCRGGGAGGTGAGGGTGRDGGSEEVEEQYPEEARGVSKVSGLIISVAFFGLVLASLLLSSSPSLAM